MESIINTNFSSTTDSGTTRFAGLSSGIDFQSAIDAIMEARRAPAVRIEQNIAANNERISAFGELKSLATDFKNSLQDLRGSTSILDEDIFDSKLAFTSSRATVGAPVGHTPSEAGNLIGVTATSDAAAGSHTVEIVQLAKANQVRTDAFTSKTDALTTQGAVAGTFSINGKDITISAADSLLDLRDAINATNTGVSPSNVTASIVSVSDTEHYLVLTSTETGAANAITFAGDQAVHNSLNLTGAGTDVAKNELQASQDAIIRVDNLGVDITRATNTITDVIEGVTLDLFQAEPNTEVVVDIENNLNSIKETIGTFVEAFNALKSFIRDQREERVREEGGEAEFGVLFSDANLRQIDNRLNQIIASSVPGLESGFASLGQVGISMDDNFQLNVDDAVLDEKLLTNLEGVRKLFSFDFSSSDSRVSAIVRTGATSYTVDGSNVPVPYYLNISGTDANGDVLEANLQTVAGAGAGGLGDGSVVREGKVLTATDFTGAEGLKVLFNGDPNLGPVNDIEVTFTRGVADRLFSFFDDITDPGGQLDDIQANLQQQNTDLADRITDIDRRLAQQRETLTQRFIAMEEALFQLNRIRQQLSQQTEATNSSN